MWQFNLSTLFLLLFISLGAHASESQHSPGMFAQDRWLIKKIDATSLSLAVGMQDPEKPGTLPKQYFTDLQVEFSELRAFLKEAFERFISNWDKEQELLAAKKQNPNDKEIEKEIARIRDLRKMDPLLGKRVRHAAPFQPSYHYQNDGKTLSQRHEEIWANTEKVIDYLENDSPFPVVTPDEESVIMRNLSEAITLIGTIQERYQPKISDYPTLKNYKGCMVLHAYVAQYTYDQLQTLLLRCVRTDTEAFYDFVWLPTRSQNGMPVEAQILHSKVPFNFLSVSGDESSPFVFAYSNNLTKLIDIRNFPPREITIPIIPIHFKKYLSDGRIAFGNTDVIHVYSPYLGRTAEVFVRQRLGYVGNVTGENLFESWERLIYIDGINFYELDPINGKSTLAKEAKLATDYPRRMKIGRNTFFANTEYNNGTSRPTLQTLSTSTQGPLKLIEQHIGIGGAWMPIEKAPSWAQEIMMEGGSVDVRKIGESNFYILSLSAESRNVKPAVTLHVLVDNKFNLIQIEGLCSEDGMILQAEWEEEGKILALVIQDKRRSDISKGIRFNVQTAEKEILVKDKKSLLLLPGTNFRKLAFLFPEQFGIAKLETDGKMSPFLFSSLLKGNIGFSLFRDDFSDIQMKLIDNFSTMILHGHGTASPLLVVQGFR